MDERFSFRFTSPQVHGRGDSGSLVPLMLCLRAMSGELNLTTPISPTTIAATDNNATLSTKPQERPTVRAVFWTTTPTTPITTTTTTTTRASWTWNQNNTKQQARSPSILSSFLSWPSMFQTQSSTLQNGSWANTNLTGRNALGLSDKYGGGGGMGQNHQYRPYYGSHSQFASYKPHMHEIPKVYGDYYYKEKHTHYLYAPPPAPLPPDGALEPVYQPHAKVAVTADFVELKCSVYGDYIPHIRWAKIAGLNHAGHLLFTTIAEGPHVIYDNYHYAVRSDGRSSRLIIREPDSRVHYGTYQCQVTVPGEHAHVIKDDFIVGHLAR